ncbi:hypothetical protein [Paenibacillus sp. sptzw28]|uniref:hypothetical protein n=1 Tax=Paenibacillus sp. sptzw28 TaxID=715179 RepID=UPI002161CA73|nr:hypothetical protein [Paenibacillus sp. sptzw28]
MTEGRILLAKNLLVSTPLAIKQIAYETGFSQSSYFNQSVSSYDWHDASAVP